jgi:hypothetical protein
MDLHALSAEHFVQLLDDLVESERLRNDATLLRATECFPGKLERLYQIIPPTLVHHDYHAKNLVIQGERIMPIDWSIAYISPHLGGLVLSNHRSALLVRYGRAQRPGCLPEGDKQLNRRN